MSDNLTSHFHNVPPTNRSYVNKVVDPGGLDDRVKQLPDLGDFYDSLVNGRIEQINNPASSKVGEARVAVTWMHTNERHAPLALTKLYGAHPEVASSVLYFCVNPRLAATEPHKGFDEHDPNRSFQPDTLANPKSYEQERAAAALGFIAAAGADYVIDPHNTVCEGFGIAAMVGKRNWQGSPAVRKIIAASNIKRIIVLDDEQADLTLLGAVPNAVTIEAEMGLTEQVAEDTAALINALVTGTSLAKKPFEREVYRIVGTVPKSEDPGLHVGNFELTIGHDGQPYFPIMLGTGPNSYRELQDRDYCCYRGVLVGTVAL